MSGVCSAVFTQNNFAAAIGFVKREHLKARAVGIFINSGNANAATGNEGIRTATDAVNLLQKWWDW